MLAPSIDRLSSCCRHHTTAVAAAPWRRPVALSLQQHTHISSSIRRVLQHAAPDDGPIGGEDMSDMKQDMERFAARQQQQQQQAGASTSGRSSSSQQAQEADGGGGVKDIIDKVLIADFFFVLLVLAWLGAGLAEKATVKSSVLVDAWMPLWPLVFQPAIGVLMAGALASGGLSWLQSQGKQQ